MKSTDCVCHEDLIANKSNTFWAQATLLFVFVCSGFCLFVCVGFVCRFVCMLCFILLCFVRLCFLVLFCILRYSFENALQRPVHIKCQWWRGQPTTEGAAHADSPALLAVPEMFTSSACEGPARSPGFHPT